MTLPLKPSVVWTYGSTHLVCLEEATMLIEEVPGLVDLQDVALRGEFGGVVAEPLHRLQARGKGPHGGLHGPRRRRGRGAGAAR